jgi:hypothetical protein
MLPTLLGLLGSGIAGTSALGGIAAGLSPLAAGAIGSGLGSFIQTGDLGEGLKAGLMSFAGGKLMGSLMNSASSGAMASGTAPVAASSATPSATAVTESLRPMARPDAAAAAIPEAGGIMDIGKRGFDFGKTAEGIGSTVGSMLSPGVMPGGVRAGSSQDEVREVPGGRDMSGVRFPEPGSRRSRGTGEFNYNFPGPYVRPPTQAVPITPVPEPQGATVGTSPTGSAFAGGGMLAPYARPTMMGMETRLAAGGLADLAEIDVMEEMPMDMPMETPEESSTSASPNDKEVIVNAVKAIKSGTPDDMNKVALANFVQKFGEEALMDLVDSVQRGDFEDIANANEGLIKGPGDAMEDLVPATNTENGEDILLSGEEFIVPGDVVSGLGNGSSEAGADELYKMMDRVRVARTGTPEQPPQIKAGGLLPA